MEYEITYHLHPEKDIVVTITAKNEVEAIIFAKQYRKDSFSIKMKFRNWIEETLKKQIAFSPVCVGSKGGRKVYAVTFEDGSETDYYIDFERKTIEEY